MPRSHHFAVLLTVHSVSSAMGAITVYSTDFESPTFTSAPSSNTLLGIDGWSIEIPPFLSPEAAKISELSPATGEQHVRVLGSEMVSADELSPDYDAVGSYRRPVDFDSRAAGAPLVRIEANVRVNAGIISGPPLIPNSSFLGPDVLSANLAARSDDGSVGELGISSDGYIYAYSDESFDPLFVRPITLNAYHHIAIEVDFDANHYRYLVDGTPLGTDIQFDPTFISDVLSRGALVTYARGDASQRANASFDFDSFSITATPEPSTAILSLGVLQRRRRRA